MDTTLQSGSMKIARIMGIPLRVHYSWLLIFGLITWSLSVFYFPNAAPGFAAQIYWLAGALAALLLFVSVAIHELAHSFVALQYNLPIANITLFIFGGVSQIKGEPTSPQAEFRIAIAGPLTSFALALLFYILYRSISHPISEVLFLYLAQLNLILGVFNLIPGFPMDGGRVLRASIWKRSKDFLSATRRASNYGQKIAIFFIILGIVSLFAGVPSGLWLMLIGWFLYSAAVGSYEQASLQETLKGVKVSEVMARGVVSVSPDMPIDMLIHDYFLKYGYGGFPVVDYGKFLGFVTLKEVKDVPKERWHDVRVSEVLTSHEKRLEVSKDDDAMKAFQMMLSEGTGRLIVTENGSMIGLITRNGIARYIQVMSRQA